ASWQFTVKINAINVCSFYSWQLPEWADGVWEQDFTDTVPLEGWLEEEVLARGVDAFDQLHLRLENVAHAQEDAENSIWSFLYEKRISHQNLIAILHHFVNSGQKQTSSFQQRILAMKAACVYFLLLEIPGSIAHKVFHPVLFDKCVAVAQKVLPQTSHGKRKLKSAPLKGSQSATGRGRKAKQPRLEEEVHDALENEDDDEEAEEVALTGQNVERLHDVACLLLKTLHCLLSVFSLKGNPQCVGHCIQVLVELTKQNSHSQKIDFALNVSASQAHSLAELAYFNLKALCTSSHGSKDEVLRNVFHRLLNHILMVGGEARANLVLAFIPQYAVTLRNQTLKFVCHLVKEVGEKCIPLLRILLQHICVKVPDKADYRGHAAQAVCKLLDCMSSSAYAEFIEWLYKYSQNAKVGYRVFALDVILELLDCPEREADSTVSAGRLRFFSHKFLMHSTVVRRCCDRMSTVRAKALSALAKSLNQHGSTAVECVHEIVQGDTTMCAAGFNVTDNSLGTANLTNTSQCVEKSSTARTVGALKTIEITDLGNETLPYGQEVLSMLKERTADEKPGVRKSALQVLEGMLQHGILPLTDVDLACLVDRCHDPALSVRKQALLSLTNLLKSHPENGTLLRAWLKGLLPAVIDRETSVQEKVLEYLDEVILKNVKEKQTGTGGSSNHDPSHKRAWDILDMLVIPEHQELVSYLGKACHMLATKNPFSASLINALLSHVQSEHAPAAWLLLSKVAGHCPKINCTKILACWDQVHRNSDVMPSTMCHILAVIGTMAKNISNDGCHQLIENLLERLRSFDCPLEVITASVSTLDHLCRAQQESQESAMKKVSVWCKELIEACDAYISRVVLTETGRVGMHEDKLIRYVFTLGEVAQLSPRNINKRIFLLVQSLLASPNLEQGETAGESEETAVPSSQPILLSQALSHFHGSSMPTIVRAHAFITLGKLCLQNEDLAKKCIPALARELEISPEISIRNNVIIIMCDLCIRYTTLVDRYISKISACLRDEEPFIRRQTLVLLTNLLQEDYVKWRGFLFHRFASVLVDSDPGIRSFAEFCLIHLLLKKHTGIIFQHFIECIFHFNSYEKHEKYQFNQTERNREKHLFSLKGSHNKSKRMTIYRLLLEHLTDEQRFNLSTKLAQNILGSFVDGMLALDMEAADLLSDIFSVLCCKEIKLVVSRARPADEELPEDGEMAMANAVMQVAQKKLISQVQKKNFVENIIPIVIMLKKQMETKRLPVLKDLMQYLREVMKDYRDEVKDVLAADKRLAAEVEYDLKKYEEEEERERARLSGDVPLPPNGPAGPSSPSSPRVHSPTAAPAPPTCPHTQPCSTSSRLPPWVSGPCTCVTCATPPPSRHQSLSTVAIVNSARKLVAAQRKIHNQSISVTTPPSNSKPVRDSKLVCIFFRKACEPRVTQGSSWRAFSTPDHTMDDMTFTDADVDLSVITSAVPNASGSQEATSCPRKDVLCLLSPDKPAPSIRPWNLSSPTGKSKKPFQPRRNTAAQKFPLSPCN
uniref:Non-SMC condensin II complex, subunit D3 n=1 Tax=Petromyzon marinus TaxID=7757 RepID=S4R8W0_PETMA